MEKVCFQDLKCGGMGEGSARCKKGAISDFKETSREALGTHSYCPYHDFL